MDNLKLGYGGTKSEMQRLVKDAAKLDKSIDANSLSYGNIVKSIHAVQKKMGIYGTTQKEAEKTVTGSLNAMKSTWGNLLTAIGSGKNLDQCLNNMVSSVEIFGNNVIPVIEKALGGIGVLVERLTPIIADKLPQLAEDLLPPLIKASVSLVKGLIKALPSIIKTLATTIVDIFGEQFPIIKKIGDFFTENAGTIASAIKKLIPVVLGLAIAFKAFKIGKSITSLFGKGGGGNSGGGFFKGITNTFKELAKTKPTTILKGMANLAIIVAGVTLLAMGIMKLAPFMAELTDIKSFGEVLLAITLVGLMGTALAKLSSFVGNIPVSTVAKGLANMAIMVAGMAALFLVVGAVSLINFDIGKIVLISLVLGVLGIIGTALTVFGGIAGLIPVSTVAMGLANMAIMLAGMSALFLLLGAVSLIDFDLAKITKIAVVLGVLGVVGMALTIFGGIAGIIPISTVAMGLANMAIMLAGMSALFLLLGAISLIDFNLARITKIALVIGVLGVVGTALAVFGGIVGLIPVAVVALGLANMAIMIAGMDALFLLIGATSLISFDYGKMLKVIGIIGILGTVGAALSVFAGIVGLIPVPVVLNGLANIGLVIGGLTALIVAFGALSKIDGFNEFISSGGDTLANLFEQIGKIGGALIGGIGEGIAESLPDIGKNLSAFATSLKPLFGMVKGVDLSGMGDFFSAMGSFMLQMAGNDIASIFTGGTDLAGLGTELSSFATNAKSFFTMVATIPEKGFSNAKLLFEALGDISNIPNTGGFAQLFSGTNDFSGTAEGLNALAETKPFFDFCASLAELAFTNATKFFEVMADISNIPNVGGVAQLFSGTNDFSGTTEGLNALVDAKPFFDMVSQLDESAFTKATQFFEALSGIGKAIPNKGGIAQWFTGENDISGVGSQLKQFGADTKAFFTQVSELKVGNLSKLWSSIKKAGEVANTDLSGLSGKGTALSTFMTKVKSFFTGAREIAGQVGAANSVANALKNFFTVINGVVTTGVSGLSNSVAQIRALAAAFVIIAPICRIVAASMQMLPPVLNAVTIPLSLVSTNFGLFSTSLSMAGASVSGVLGGFIALVSTIALVTTAITLLKTETLTLPVTFSMAFVMALTIVTIQSNALVRVVQQMGNSLVSTIQQAMRSLVSIVASVNLYSSGYNAMLGLNNGLLAGKDLVLSTARSIANSIKTTMDNALDIHSPSRLLEDSGFNAGMGTVVGLEKSKPFVEKQTEELSCAISCGIDGYSPESSVTTNRTSKTEYNTYSPQFNLTIQGSADNTTKRRVKQWVKESMEEVFASMGRSNYELQEV